MTTHMNIRMRMRFSPICHILLSVSVLCSSLFAESRASAVHDNGMHLIDKTSISNNRSRAFNFDSLMVGASSLHPANLNSCCSGRVIHHISLDTRGSISAAHSVGADNWLEAAPSTSGQDAVFVLGYRRLLASAADDDDPDSGGRRSSTLNIGLTLLVVAAAAALLV